MKDLKPTMMIPPEGIAYVPVDSLLAIDGEPSFGKARRLTAGEKIIFPKDSITISEQVSEQAQSR